MTVIVPLGADEPAVSHAARKTHRPDVVIPCLILRGNRHAKGQIITILLTLLVCSEPHF